MTKSKFYLSAAMLALIASPAYADGPVLEITNFIGQIYVSETDSDIEVSGETSSTLNQSGDTVLINGEETIKNSNCRNVNGNISLSFGKSSWGWTKGGYKDLDDYPRLKIKAPANTHLIIKDSVVFGTVSNLGSADLHISSCGNLDVGNINGPLDAYISGSGDLTVGDVSNETTVKISGSGDFQAGDVTDLQIKVSGSGDGSFGNVTVSARDATEVSVSGSGDLEIAKINGDADMRLSGSGNAEIEALHGSLIYEGRGSGDIVIDDIIAERVSVRTGGSGDVDVNDGTIGTLLVTASGSSTLDLDIIAEDVMIKSSGSSDVNIDDATGERDIRVSAAGDVRIGRKSYER